MNVELIVATDRNGAIGKNNQLLWHLPEDLKYFKKTTLGHAVLMGRKTFESIGKSLPGRTNLILSRSDFKAEGAITLKDWEDAASYVEEGKKLFIIGGSEIYNMFIDKVEYVHQTLVDAEFKDADTFFPIQRLKENFMLIKNECHSRNDKNPFDYCFRLWKKK